MTNHIHHDAIIAWAKGAEIEFLSESGKWINANTPMWRTDMQYRVKPEPIIRDVTHNLYINSVEELALAFEKKGVGRVHPSYKLIGSIKLTFQDGVIVNYSETFIDGVS